MSVLATTALAVAAAPVMLAASYLGALALAARELPLPARGGRRWRFDVVVPAHDEEVGIARTVRSLRALDWPVDRFRILVVADNCSDRTAELARAAGAVVLERVDPARRGKGYALAFAFDASRRDGFADAVAVVDADTIALPGLLASFAARLDAGLDAVQAHYAVRNANASWRTRLMDIAFALFHGVRSEARERLGLSCGLRGNGMCFTHTLLDRVPHDAFSIVEDLEYGLALGRAGVRVGYAAEARVYGEMPAGAEASRTQRDRWEHGRSAIARAQTLPLFALALRRRSLLLADLAMDLVVPPLSRLVAAAAAGLALASLAARSGIVSPFVVLPWALSALALAVYVARGWQRSGTGARGVADMLWAPVYLVWKVAARRRRPLDHWVRTARTPAQQET